MSSQKVILAFFLIVGILVTCLLALRLVIGGEEDAWVCKNGQWVAHGTPANSKPNLPCGPETAAPEVSPKSVVESFYRWYVSGGIGNSEYQKRTELSEGLKLKIADIKKNANFNPILLAQDVPSSLKFNQVSVKDDIARVEVTEQFGSSNKTIEVALSKQNEHWLITDIGEKEGDPVASDSEGKTVVLYYSNLNRSQGSTECGVVFGVERELASTASYENLMIALVAGPTEAEKKQGYSSFFTPKTGGIIKSVRVDGKTAFVDLIDLRTLLPNASSSCGSQQLLAEMGETLKHDRKIQNVCYAIDGDPNTFYEWLQLSTPKNCQSSNFK